MVVPLLIGVAVVAIAWRFGTNAGRDPEHRAELLEAIGNVISGTGMWLAVATFVAIPVVIVVVLIVAAIRAI